MYILISFCVCVRPGLCSLGLLDPRSLELRSVICSGLREEPEELTGLAADDRYIYVGARRPASLIVLDRNSQRVLERNLLPGAIDVHSLCLRKGLVYLVSTGTDEVWEVEMEGPCVASHRVAWRPDLDLPTIDSHHLNGLCTAHEELVVSGFGKRIGT